MQQEVREVHHHFGGRRKGGAVRSAAASRGFLGGAPLPWRQFRRRSQSSIRRQKGQYNK